MILILACRSCCRTSAVMPALDRMEVPRQETELVWVCLHCKEEHRWLIPPGRSVEDTARESLKHSPAHARSMKRTDIYEKLDAAEPEMRRKILMGELIWWWREEARLGQEEAAAKADCSARQWKRIEAGESMPRRQNLEAIVQAVRGNMEQAYLVMGFDRMWDRDLARRIAELKERISPSADFQIHPEGWELPPGIESDVQLALREFRRVLPAEPHEDKFLLFAHGIHQAYWMRLMKGPITIDDNRAEIMPVIQKLIDILERCENRQAQYRVIYLMARGAEFFMMESQVADLVTYFLLSSFSSHAGEHETRRRIPEEWRQSSSRERLILTLFDLIAPLNQPQLIEACRKLHGSARQDDEYFKE